MKFFLIFFLIFPSLAFGRDCIVLYKINGTEEIYGGFKKLCETEGIMLKTFDAFKNIERQVENAEKINAEDCLLFVASSVRHSKENAFVLAIPEAEKSSGLFLSVEDISSLYIETSKKIAGYLSEEFHVKVKRLPLFPFLGIKLPAIFLLIRYEDEKFPERIFSAILRSLFLLRKGGKE